MQGASSMRSGIGWVLGPQQPAGVAAGARTRSTLRRTRQPSRSADQELQQLALTINSLKPWRALSARDLTCNPMHTQQAVPRNMGLERWASEKLLPAIVDKAPVQRSGPALWPHTTVPHTCLSGTFPATPPAPRQGCAGTPGASATGKTELEAMPPR